MKFLLRFIEKHVLLSTIFGMLIGFILGITKDILIAHISPFIKLKSEEEIEEIKSKKYFIQDIFIELEKGNTQDFSYKLNRFKEISEKLNEKLLFTKSEIKQLNLIESKANVEKEKFLMWNPPTFLNEMISDHAILNPQKNILIS